jgi:SAM-dependent methyltransferase/Tfp pilus assembly protein PilF
MNRKDRRAAAKRGASSGLISAPSISPQVAQVLREAQIQRGYGDFKAAESIYRSALASHPRDPWLHNALGKQLADAGDFDAAADHFDRALSLAPNFAQAYQALAEAQFAQHQIQSVASCQRALQLEPHLLSAHTTYAKILMAMGENGQALNYLKAVLDTSPTNEAKILFVACMTRLQFDSASPELHRALIQAINEPWSDRSELNKLVCPIIKLDPAVKSGIEHCTRISMQTKPDFDDLLSTVCINRLLVAAMESLPLYDIELERLLTASRSVLLGKALSGGPSDRHTVVFASALARQCFINEYVYAVSHQDAAQLAKLRKSVLEKLENDSPVSPLALAVLAAFRSLDGLPSAERLLRDKWPPAVDALLTQQLREPAGDRLLRDQVPILTPIDDVVSNAVRRQYEENPYPRWVKTTQLAEPSTLDRLMKNKFPFAELQKANSSTEFDILIAGCGTGQQVVDTAPLFPKARILAIDLSVASLAYAKRKIDEAGQTNVEIAQADILRISELERSFDLISAGGVLHHMGNPAAGWKQLAAVLRPGGFMMLAVYSEIGRRDTVATQQWAAERGFSGTVDDIRQCRQEILATRDRPEFDEVKSLADFYATSEVRDLLFHVQEHRFTLPQIGGLIAANGLNFVGFEMGHEVLKRYKTRFPKDLSMTNLAKWHEFERENPRTFLHMYQFWLQKPG